MKYIFIVFFLVSNLVYSQYSDQIFNYDNNVTFKIVKLRGSPKGFMGYSPLRGYYSYSIYLEFTNNSSSTGRTRFGEHLFSKSKD